MNLVTLFLISIGLSMDAFAVSIGLGIRQAQINFMAALRIAGTFAAFHVAMPLLGWLLGTQVERFINHYDHWVAFGLLVFLGLKMIRESLHPDENNSNNPSGTSTLLLLALATSVDALAVGISLAFLGSNIWLAGMSFGAVVMVVSMLGMLFGKKMGQRFGSRMEVLGGLTLIVIGLKILLEHLGN